MLQAKILIVDDEPALCAAYAAWVEKMGAHATVAHSILEGEAALARDTFDLLLSDVHLAGNQQLRWIKRVISHRDPPFIVLLTGQPDLESTLGAVNLAVSGYLLKPVDYHALETLCSQLISKRRQHRALHDLAAETEQLLNSTSEPALDPAVREHLVQLSQHLAKSRPLTSIPPSAEDGWRAAITEAIEVLEKTKHAFRSKDLGLLRRRLEATLHEQTQV